MQEMLESQESAAAEKIHHTEREDDDEGHDSTRMEEGEGRWISDRASAVIK